MRKLWRLLQPPALADPEARRVATTIYQVALVTLLCGLASVSVRSVLGFAETGLSPSLAFVVMSLLTLALLRWGFPRAAIWLLISTWWVVLAGYVLRVGSVNPPVLGAFMAVILAAGVLMGARSALLITLASAAMPLLALWIPDTAVPGVAPSFSGLDMAVGEVFVLLAGAALAMLVTQQIRVALERARKNEANLAESRERYRSLLESLPDVITEIGEDGRNCYVGPNSREVLGYEPQELMGRDPFELIHAEDRPAVLAALAELRESGRHAPPAFRFRSADGRWQ